MIWIITELFYPDEVSTAQIIMDIALKKAEKEEVHVLCGPIGYEKSYHAKNIVLSENIKIHRISLPNLDKNILLERVLRLLLLTVKMSWFIFIKVKKNDNVFQVTNPTFLILTTSILKSLKKFKLEILVHDVFPENLVPANLVKRDSFKYRFLCKIYNYAYSKADRLIVLGEDMKKLMLSKVNNKHTIIDVIPNWADEEIKPLSDFDASNYLQLDLKGKIVLGFAGNLGRLQGIVEFLDIFKKCNNAALALVIIGDGALSTELKNKIEQESIQNVHYLGSKPRSEQNKFLNSCNIGLVTLKKGMIGLGVPSKTYNIMAAGKPILYIGDKNSEIDNYVNTMNCGWSFEWNPEQICEFLRNISDFNNFELKEKGLNAQNSINKFFTKDIILSKFE